MLMLRLFLLPGFSARQLESHKEEAVGVGIFFAVFFFVGLTVFIYDMAESILLCRTGNKHTPPSHINIQDSRLRDQQHVEIIKNTCINRPVSVPISDFSQCSHLCGENSCIQLLRQRYIRMKPVTKEKGKWNFPATPTFLIFGI